MKSSKSKLQIILSHTCTYFNFLNLVLALLVVISGQYKHMLFMGIVVFNSLIGIVQELKVKNLVDKLSVITATKARLITDDGIREIPLEDVRIDHKLQIAVGDQIAFDSTVLTSDGLEVNESLLTGESLPVHKNPGDTLFSGSHIVAGSGSCQVVHVGEDNYATQLVQKAKTKKRASSEMQNAIKKIIRFVSYAIFPVGVLLFYIQYFRVGANLSNALVSTTAGVLGMIPEGLVLLTSISFILGVGRLATKRALVQEMEAIEALARVNVLCLDKTGTITTGDLAVEQIIPLLKNDGTQISQERIHSILHTVVYTFTEDNATSAALKTYLETNSTAPLVEDKDAIMESIPFSSRRKFMGISLRQSGSFVLGAPDFLTKSQDVLQQAEQFEKQGLRVLLLAFCSNLADSPDKLRDIKPLALITLTDQIKENAPEIFRFFKKQGVDIKVISGDNPATVSAVGVRAGLPQAERYIDATELEGLSEEEIADRVSRHTVFGRVSPEMKQMIIKAYQKNKKTVGMVGDGVNDVLALKDADCGIAMANGADAARQSAHIVLLDSDFGSMPDIVKEGRTIIANIERVSALYLTKTIYSILLCVIFIILGKSYPFIPIQLTLIGATAIGIPSFLLTLERHDTVTSSGFLRHVMRISLPGAILLTALLVTIQFAAAPLGLDRLIVSTLNLLTGGIVSLSIVAVVCRPMNKRRLALCLGVTLLFFGGMLLMPGLFDIYPLL